MVSFEGVSKNYGEQTVLDRVSFRVNPGERLGIVGPNGSGKSTLFAMVAGEISPDGGRVTVRRGIRLGYVHQQVRSCAEGTTLFEYSEDAVPEIRELEQKLHALEAAMAGASAPADRERELRQHGDAQHRLEAIGGYALQHRTAATLCGLGFETAEFGRPFRSLSGGWQLRAELARVLVAEPELLLLDEPSNYLDTPAVEWLQKFLRDYRGTLMLISHDRYLLNSLTRSTIEVFRGSVARYSGNFDAYMQEREQRMHQLDAAARNQDRQRRQMERFVERFKATSTKASQAQSKAKAIERLEKIEKPPALVTRGKIRLRPPPHSGQEVVRLEAAGFSYDAQHWVLRGVELRIERGEKIAFVGRNGFGKTTLLRLLAGRLSLTEGRRVLGHKVNVGYQSQDFAETLPPNRTAFEVVKAASGGASDQDVRTLLGGFGFPGAHVEKPVEVLSGGEKVRLAFARLLADPPNFLLLDEPTTHLDIWARAALEDALAAFEGTVCVVSHDVDFLRHVAGTIIAMEPPGIRRFWGGYDDYQRRMEEEAAAETAAAQQRPAPAAADGGDRRAVRRERAQARQSAARDRAGLRRRVDEAEKRVAALEAEQNRLLEQLNPLGPPPASYETINRRLAEVHVDLHKVTRQWEEAASALETLEQSLSAEP